MPAGTRGKVYFLLLREPSTRWLLPHKKHLYKYQEPQSSFTLWFFLEEIYQIREYQINLFAKQFFSFSVPFFQSKKCSNSTARNGSQ